MNITKKRILTGLLAFSALAGCNSEPETDESISSVKETASSIAKASPVSQGINLTMFNKNAFVEEPTIVDCTTAEGTQTTCYKLVTSGAPAGREPGPFCPRTTSDGPEDAGKWFSKNGSGELIDITGQFILKLDEYYGDDKWAVYDAKTNKIRYTATKAACLGAARPDVEEQYKQNCIECQLSYLEDDFTITYLIPTTPIPSDKTPGRVHTVGIALDGAELSGPAPVNAILGSYTIAAFDDCGGHINTHQGYHYHSTTGCTDKNEPTADGHAPLIGYASDGYPIYAMKDAEGKEEVLDECRGTTDAIRGYHYHAASPSENMFIGCMHGETVAPIGGPGGESPDGKPPKSK